MDAPATKVKPKSQTFGQRLTAIRESVKLSRADFAAKLGLKSSEIISLLEQSEQLSTIQALERIAENHGTDLHELITGQPSPAISTEVIRLRAIKGQLRTMRAEIKKEHAAIKKLSANCDKAIRAASETLKPYA